MVGELFVVRSRMSFAEATVDRLKEIDVLTITVALDVGLDWAIANYHQLSGFAG